MGTETTPHERKKLLKSCRFCVLSSAFVDQGILFKQIFKSGDHDAGLKNKIFELLKITIEKNENRPTIICQNCLDMLQKWSDMQKIYKSLFLINTNKSCNDSAFCDLTPFEFEQSEENDTHGQELDTIQNLIDLTSDDEDNKDNTVNAPQTNDLNDDYDENSSELSSENENKVKPMHKQLLFTCLKPNCNVIFKYFASFMLHYRTHFKSEKLLMCWSCCSRYTSMKDLRNHQKSLVDCNTTGLFKCFKCVTVFKDIQSLSIHKLITHNAKLKVRKLMTVCPICKASIVNKSFKNHVINCHQK